VTRWWEQRALLGAAMLAATVPLWLVSLPPLIDLLGHMGRYHLQWSAAGRPALAAHWAVHWHWIGNMGGDLLMLLLTPLFGIETGAILLSALLLVVMISGIARLALAAHGRLPSTTWAAFPFAMAYPWQYGLVNYWLGIGLALHAAASCWSQSRGTGRGLIIAIISLLLWTVHIFGWAVFATLLVARRLAATGFRERRESLMLLVALGVPLIVMAAQRYGSGGSAAATLGWFRWSYKAMALSWTLRDQFELFDRGCLAAALALILLGVTSKAFMVDRPLAVGAALLLAELALLPYQLFGSAFADGRLWPVVLIVGMIAIRPQDARHDARIALVAALLFAVRIAITTAGFQRYDAAYARHLAALDLVPRGGRIAVLVDFPCSTPWRRERLEHLDGIAIVRRDAFTNGQWAVPGAELVDPLAARGTGFNSDPSELLRSCGDPRPDLARALAALPRDRFDFVWLLAYPIAKLPPYPGLERRFADDRTILYRIVK